MKRLIQCLISFSLLCCCNGKQASTPDQSMLPGDPTDWELVWNEEFDYPDEQLDQYWESQHAPSTHILCSRWRENVVVENGMLKLINKKEQRGGQEWTSGSIWSRQQFQYGYFECRYRYAAAEGTNNSFWLMTRGIEPKEGKKFEIDINEGHFPNEVNTNIHNWTDITVVDGKNTHPSNSKSFDADALLLDEKARMTDFASEFHTYGLAWDEAELIFYLDGREIRREKNEFCHSPVPVWLSLAIISWAGEITDAIDGTFMEVDYVSVYRKNKK